MEPMTAEDEEEERMTSGMTCVSCRQHIAVICGSCGTRQPRLYKERAKIPVKEAGHVTLANSVVQVNVGNKPAVSTHNASMLTRNARGRVRIQKVEHLTLAQRHTTINIGTDSNTTCPVGINVATDARQLQAASDGVLILRTDWSEAENNLSNAAAQSDNETGHVKTPHQQGEQTQLKRPLQTEGFGELRSCDPPLSSVDGSRRVDRGSRDPSQVPGRSIGDLALGDEQTQAQGLADEASRSDNETYVKEVRSHADDQTSLKQPATSRGTNAVSKQDGGSEREIVVTRMVDRYTDSLFTEVLAEIRREDLSHKVVLELFQRFRLRLLGLTKRLEVLMEVKSEDVEELLRLQPEVQEVLAEFLPRHRRQEVTWENFSRQSIQCSDDVSGGDDVSGDDDVSCGDDVTVGDDVSYCHDINHGNDVSGERHDRAQGSEFDDVEQFSPVGMDAPIERRNESQTASEQALSAVSVSKNSIVGCFLGDLVSQGCF